MSRIAQWHKLPVTLAELCIDTTLRCGQSFRWRKFDDEWRCSLHGRIISLKQDEECVYYKSIYPETKASLRSSPSRASPGAKDETTDTKDDTESLLRSYFNLQLDLGALYAQWSRDDPNFRKKAPKFSGIRILNQDAWEALVCFICSSNNNISRISQMAHKLCQHYGPFLGTVDGEPYHDFPTPTALMAPDVESNLRQLGFGYRAKYIAQTAKFVCNDKPPGWLTQLRNPRCPDWPRHPDAEAVQSVDSVESKTLKSEPTESAFEVPSYKHAQEQLLTLSGVGPKVSDCVCLMGLGWGEAVPVDTHVWQIAVRDYKFKKQASKTFSKGMHDAVGDHFRSLWGEYAGWAQSVLFTANLRAFSDRLKTEVGEVKAEEVKEDADSITKDEFVKLEETETVISSITPKDEAGTQMVTSRTRKRKIKVEEDVAVRVETQTTRSTRRRTAR